MLHYQVMKTLKDFKINFEDIQAAPKKRRKNSDMLVVSGSPYRIEVTGSTPQQKFITKCSSVIPGKSKKSNLG